MCFLSLWSLLFSVLLLVIMGLLVRLVILVFLVALCIYVYVCLRVTLVLVVILVNIVWIALLAVLVNVPLSFDCSCYSRSSCSSLLRPEDNGCTV